MVKIEKEKLMHTNNMKLSIIIVSWNVKKDLANCLRSIGENSPNSQFEIIVIDNASTDTTVESVKEYFPEVVMIANSENRGFAAANNQGIERSHGEYILLLNPDTIVRLGSLDTLISLIDKNEDVGICGPQLLNQDGTIQSSARCFPTFRGALYRHTIFRYLRIFKNEYKKWLMKGFDHRTQTDVDQVMGAALMVRRSVIDHIGVMDERFFMYYEEVDLCYRIKQAGWRVVFVPQATITHLGGRSSGQIPVEKQIMAMTSLLKFFRKHRGKGVTAAFSCVFKPAILLRNLCDLATSVFIYLFSIITVNRKRQSKSASKIINSLKLVFIYSWQILFKM
jgi:GT2 family glycosyltransferase